MRNRVGSLIAPVVFLLGCNEPVELAEPVADLVVSESDSAGIRMVRISGSVAALPEWRLGETLTEISGNAEPYLSRVGTVAFHGERDLIVEDGQSSQLYSFSSDGQGFELLAGPGDGPGEIRSVAQVTVTAGDTSYVFDSRQTRISVFGDDGGLLATIPVSPDFAGEATYVRNGWAFDSGRFLLYGYGRSAEELRGSTEFPNRVVREGILQIVSADGIGLASPLRFTGETIVQWETGRANSPFWNRPVVAANTDRIIYGSGLEYELVVHDLGLQPLLMIRWSDWREPLTASTLKTLRGPMSASIHELRAVSPDGADRIMEALFHPDVLPEALPALGSALLDEDGHIWVSRFRPSAHLPRTLAGGYEQWREEDVWHVLDSDGIPMARFTLPVDTRLLAVRSDRVAVVTRDRVGVEHVRVLAIDHGQKAR